MEVGEAKSILEAYYSSVFQIFYDSFALTESTLKQKSKKWNYIYVSEQFLTDFVIGHRVQREELDAVLILLEKILILLPELLQQRWQKHALTRLFKRLLHPANYSKLRRDSMKYEILYLSLNFSKIKFLIFSNHPGYSFFGTKYWVNKQMPAFTQCLPV